MFVKYYPCFLLVYNFCFAQQWQSKKPIVQLKEGKLEGEAVYTDSSRIAFSYLGIPYAAPPVGDLRFAPPQKHSGWNGTLQAKSFAPRCPQPSRTPGDYAEDCLYLNIWTPAIASQSPPLPVTIFFEGTDFYTSSTIRLNGQDLAIEGTVFITVGYRLNAFGFFCLGTAQARGNLGLLDQYIALIWVKENVKQFGGDPEKITLFGHSSGGTSVSFHMVSPRTAGLFQRAIISSGTAVAPWIVNNDPITASKQLTKLLGCFYNADVLSCLRAKPVEHILQALQEYSESLNWIDMFLPVVDSFLPENNRYLPLSFMEAVRAGTYLQVPILMGISRTISNPQFNEWLQLASQGYLQLQQYVEKAKIPEIIRRYRFSSASKDQIFDLIKWQYGFSQQDVRITFKELKNLEYDSKIESMQFLQLSYLVSSYVQPIFFYCLEDIGFVLNTTDELVSSDLLLLFGPVFLKQAGRRRFSASELRLSYLLKMMWIKFITFGNPTPTNGAAWRKYTSEDPYIEYFDPRYSSSEETRRRMMKISFWNMLLPKISNFRSNLSNNIPKELQNSPDPAAGFRHAMYTLVGLVIALLSLLLVCIFLLKKRSKEREKHLHMGY